ncbi:hypothetical protein [Glycomyces tenuis]|uniref:hypothetical protein n=1 Tax=Glycomyces tenuis TaxID=58116 RepID=UPI0003F80D72|nr:hypothetical protein [Glycomyces tenuis]
MRISTPLAGALVAALALAGCAGEEPPDGAETTAAEADGASPTAEPTESEPEVFRESMGLFRATDPATAELDALLSTGQEVALDLTLSIEAEIIETTDGAAGGVDLWFFFDGGEDEFLTVNVPEDALALGGTEGQDYLSTLRGVFSVEASGEAGVDYTLTSTGDIAEFEARDEERCGEEDEFVADAETLADDPAAYEMVRERWADSPRLWWAVKSTAHSLAEYGDVGDFMATACSIYW